MRLRNLPEQHIARKMYVMLHSLDNLGFTTWVTHLRKILEKYNLGNFLAIENNSPIEYNNIKQEVLRSYESSYLSTIQNSQQYPKLRTYKLFKKNFSSELYLDLHIPKYRISLARLRTSSHHLEIERGRYTIPKTPVELRLCKQCDQGVVEDEIHFVIACKKYKLLRENMFNIVNLMIPHFISMNDHEKFCMLLISQNVEVIHALAKYCHLSFKLRTEG